MNTSLVSIDAHTGKMSELSAEHHEELDAQELSAIDVKRGKYYTAGVNRTTNKVNLCVWSLGSGHKEKQVELPFESSALVGVGEAIDVDPTDGTIIAMGHDKSRGGHHCVYKGDADTLKFTFVADVGGDMHSDVLGGSTTFDYDAKVAYVVISYNDSTPTPAIKFSAVHLSGTVDDLDTSLQMASMAYDSHTKRIYGTVVSKTSASAATPVTLHHQPELLRRAAFPMPPRRGAHAAPADPYRHADGLAIADGFQRSLAYFDSVKRDKVMPPSLPTTMRHVADRAALAATWPTVPPSLCHVADRAAPRCATWQVVPVAALPLSMAIGDVHALDVAGRTPAFSPSNLIEPNRT